MTRDVWHTEKNRNIVVDSNTAAFGNGNIQELNQGRGKKRNINTCKNNKCKSQCT